MCGEAAWGSNTTPTTTGYEPRSETLNSFIGTDPSRWRTALPTYSALGYEQLYPGIDLRFDGADGQLKSTYSVAPGSDPRQIRWRYDGAQTVSVDAQGNLVVTLPVTITRERARGEARAEASAVRATKVVTLTEATPIAWQERDGIRVPVSVAYTVSANQEVAFTLGAYDASLPLLIDPTLTYSTLLGGSGLEGGAAIAVDSAGQAVIAGDTTSTDFPGLGTPVGLSDIFVVKLNASGQVVQRTLVGGSGYDSVADSNGDVAKAIAIDASGNIYVAGSSDSTDFPTTAGAYDRTCGTDGTCNLAGTLRYDDSVVVRLTGSGSLSYGTYLGGSHLETVMGVALDSTNAVYVTGDTRSSDFPVRNAYDSVRDGDYDAFVSKLR